jgi:hypothetical protein
MLPADCLLARAAQPGIVTFAARQHARRMAGHAGFS